MSKTQEVIICPLREILRVIWYFRPGEIPGSEKEFANAECLRKFCAWYNIETKSCCINPKQRFLFD